MAVARVTATIESSVEASDAAHELGDQRSGSRFTSYP